MNYDGYEQGFANMRLVVKEKEDYTFAPFSNVETYDQAYAIAETEKPSAYMRHAIRENEEDYTFLPNNVVFNDFETKNKVFGTIKVFKGYSNWRQTEDNMFQQNKYLCKYGEVANGHSNMRQTNMRYTKDNMFQPDRFLGECAKGAMGYSNIRQTEDNMFQPDRFLGDSADVAMGYSNMRQTEDNMCRMVPKDKISSTKRPEVVTLGPWGGTGGMQFDDGSNYTGVREIQLTLSASGGLVSIQVFYDSKGQIKPGKKNGDGGSTSKKITFGPSERLTHISGYYGPLMESTIIKSITFHTNEKEHGPYGDKQGTRFSSDSSSSKDKKIVGFHGKLKRGFVHSIGVYVMKG